MAEIKVVDCHQVTLDEYMSYTQEIKERLNAAINNFIIVGYNLKRIRDSKAYESAGYASMKDYVIQELKLSPATASKFMRLNDEYSEDGNSRLIKKEYQGYGYNKLYEMLSLPETDRQLLTTESTVQDIREMKAFNKEEADKPAVPETAEPDALARAIWELLDADTQKMLKSLSVAQFADRVNPSGNKLLRKYGKLIIMKSVGEGIVVKEAGNTRTLSYADLKEMLNVFDVETAEEKPQEEVRNETTEGPVKPAPEPIEIEHAAPASGTEEKLEIEKITITEDDIIPPPAVKMQKTEEEKPKTAEKKADTTSVPQGKWQMSRIEYVKSLSAVQLALYMRDNLRDVNLNSMTAIQKWLDSTVDKYGNTVKIG